MRLKFSRNAFKITAVLVGVICLLISVFLLLQAFGAKQGQSPSLDTDRDSITYGGVEYTQRKELDTVLIMGLDKFGEDESAGAYLNRQQADFMLLVAVDRQAKTYSVLHLNRDTMTDMSVLGDRGEPVGTVHRQLALSHTYGTGGRDSCRNSAEAVSNLLHGVKIDHYLSLTMDAVASLNDAVGGVTVEILDDFTAFDPAMIKGETLTLKGQQALTYVRTRKGLEDSSNLHRMERQRQYISAFQERMTAKMNGDPEFFAKSMAKISDNLVSDLTVNQMSVLGEHLDGYTFTGFSTIEGEAVKGETFMEYYPDEDKLMQTVLELYFKAKK